MDDEAQLDQLGLEDKGLVAHMAEARSVFRESVRSQEAPGSPDALRKESTAASQGLSALMVSLKGLEMGLRCAAEDVLLVGGNAAALSAGETPHGYPANSAEALARLAKQSKAAGNALAEQVRQLEDAQVVLTIARRAHELAVEGLLRLAAPPR